MSVIIPGVHVSTAARIHDWHALGRHIASASSPEQAEFLAGFAEALHFAQPGYIADDVVKGNAADAIVDTLQSLTISIDKARS
jgi:hypothetical protein